MEKKKQQQKKKNKQKTYQKFVMATNPCVLSNLKLEENSSVVILKVIFLYFATKS